MVGKRLDTLQGRIRNQYLIVTGTADSPDIACQAPDTWYKLAHRGSGQEEALQGFSPGASDWGPKGKPESSISPVYGWGRTRRADVS